LTTNPQRFSGPELSILLSQVRDELGADATILEANRRREGGIGGFFAKERFEVLAAVGSEDPVDAVEPALTTRRLESHDELLLSRAEQVSAVERSSARSDDDRFDEILRTALDDLGAAPPAPAPPPPLPRHRGEQPEPGDAVAIASVGLPPPPPPPPSEGSRYPVGSPEAANAPDIDRLPGGRFWSRLLRFEHLLADEPALEPVTTLVGPAEDAVAVAREVAQRAGIDHADLVVVTERVALDGVPPWQLVDGREPLVERLRYWRANGRSAMVVIDLDTDERGTHRAARLAAAVGSGSVRLVVRSVADPAALAVQLRELGPIAAIDVSRPPDPVRLVQLVEHGIRVATVCGRPLTPTLLAGIASAGDHD
jgi:hypothetical protein